MDYKINANIVVAEDDGATAVVGFAGDELGNYVQIQYGWEPDEQDRGLEMDGPYLELNDQSLSLYNGLGAIEVNSSGVVLLLTPRAMHRLAVNGNIVIIGVADCPGFAEAVSLLRRIAEACGIEMSA